MRLANDGGAPVFLDSTFSEMSNISQFLSKLNWFLQTPSSPRNIVSSLFLRSLSLVYLVAFSSVLWQKELITLNGLIPFADFANKTIQHDGLFSILVYPSVFWISQSDLFIHLVLIAAIVTSLLSLIWRQFTINYVLKWFLYLSIVTFGRDVFQFPWDTFLLELGFLSIFVVHYNNQGQLPRILLFALLLLFFRQWASMAMTKLLWSSVFWSDLSYMQHFWLNQPSPTPIGCLLSKLPSEVHKVITALTLLVECSIVATMFFGRKGRVISFLLCLSMSVFIQISGNYGFFNLVTVVASLWCLDDGIFPSWTTNGMKKEIHVQGLWNPIPTVVLAMLVTFNLYYLIHLAVKQENHADFLNYRLANEVDQNADFLERSFYSIGKVISSWRLVSPHGVFKNISYKRPYIKVYAQNEYGVNVPMTFRKGNEITNFSLSAPFMNRLQYMLFYQSFGIEFRSFLLNLNPNGIYLDSWMKSLIGGILEGKQPIYKLVEFNGLVQIDYLLVQQVLLKPDCMTSDCFSECENYLVLDSISIQATDKIITPLFHVETIFNHK